MEWHDESTIILTTSRGSSFIQNKGSAEARLLYEVCEAVLPKVTKTLPSDPTTSDYLAALRNPWGWSTESLRRARLWGADIAEYAMKHSPPRDDVVKPLSFGLGWSTNLDP